MLVRQYGGVAARVSTVSILLAHPSSVLKSVAFCDHSCVCGYVFPVLALGPKTRASSAQDNGVLTREGQRSPFWTRVDGLKRAFFMLEHDCGA